MTNVVTLPLDKLLSLPGLQQYIPAPGLRNWVQCYWVLQRAQAPVQRENLYPDGGSSLVLDFSGQGVQIHFHAQHVRQELTIDQNLDRIGIRFQPGGAFQLLGVDMADSDRINQAVIQQVLDTSYMPEQLAAAQDIPARVALIDDWLLRAALRVSLGNRWIERIMPRLWDVDISIENLSNDVAMSRRQLERRFQQQVGIAPVKLKQLWRIKQARWMIAQTPERPVTQVAMDTGFYDQAHFTRQFQQITGQTPGQYRQRKMSQKYNPSTD